jgi:hypothetical protein
MYTHPFKTAFDGASDGEDQRQMIENTWILFYFVYPTGLCGFAYAEFDSRTKRSWCLEEIRGCVHMCVYSFLVWSAHKTVVMEQELGWCF